VTHATAFDYAVQNLPRRRPDSGGAAPLPLRVCGPDPPFRARTPRSAGKTRAT